MSEKELSCKDCRQYVWSWDPPCKYCVWTPKKGYCGRFVAKRVPGVTNYGGTVTTQY